MEQILLYLLVALNVVVLGWLIFLTTRYQKIVQKAGILFEQEVPGNLLEVVKKHLKIVQEVEDHCYEVEKELKSVSKLAEAGLHKVGFLRYNPFGDVGGNLSFSVALLNETEDGFVISSIHAREGTRVYAKPVERGVSDFNLSEEEKRAIEIAKKSK